MTIYKFIPTEYIYSTCIVIFFQKKVNPDLVVDIKPSLRHRKIQEERLRRQQMMDDYWKRREEERWREEMRLFFIFLP